VVFSSLLFLFPIETLGWNSLPFLRAGFLLVLFFFFLFFSFVLFFFFLLVLLCVPNYATSVPIPFPLPRAGMDNPFPSAATRNFFSSFPFPFPLWRFTDLDPYRVRSIFRRFVFFTNPPPFRSIYTPFFFFVLDEILPKFLWVPSHPDDSLKDLSYFSPPLVPGGYPSQGIIMQICFMGRVFLDSITSISGPTPFISPLSPDVSLFPPPLLGTLLHLPSRYGLALQNPLSP